MAAIAAGAPERREKAAQLDEWLVDMCGIDDVQERTEVLDAFVDPRYAFTSQNILINELSKVTSPTRSSTCCLLLLIKILS